MTQYFQSHLCINHPCWTRNGQTFCRTMLYLNISSKKKYEERMLPNGVIANRRSKKTPYTKFMGTCRVMNCFEEMYAINSTNEICRAPFGIFRWNSLVCADPSSAVRDVDVVGAKSQDSAKAVKYYLCIPKRQSLYEWMYCRCTYVWYTLYTTTGRFSPNFSYLKYRKFECVVEGVLRAEPCSPILSSTSGPLAHNTSNEARCCPQSHMSRK